MSSNGYFDPTNTSNPWNQAAEMQIGIGDQVGVQKLGAINTLPNTVAAVAVRQKNVTFSLSVNTQVSVAHGCLDENGKAVTPLSYPPVVSSSNGFYFSAVADDTNIYMTAPAGATTTVTGTLAVQY